MDKEELNVILENHKKWLETKDTDNVDEKRACLSFADLSNIDLHGADLRYFDLSIADLCGANLSYSDLSNTDLRCTDLRCADLRCADLHNSYLLDVDLSGADLQDVNLSSANLSGADLRDADLCGANLRGADLRYSDLSGTNLSCADLNETSLYGADLSGADLYCAYLHSTDLTNVKYDDTTKFFFMICPEAGSFVGYKKAGNNKIVELLIPKDALRSSATTNKCRCNKAKVLSITNIDGSEYGECYVRSDYDKKFIYKVGEIIEVKDFNTDRWNECTTGIHFFMTRDEAVKY